MMLSWDLKSSQKEDGLSWLSRKWCNLKDESPKMEQRAAGRVPFKKIGGLRGEL